MVRSTRASPRTQRHPVAKGRSIDETIKAEFGFESFDNISNQRFCFQQNKFIYCCCVLGSLCVIAAVFVSSNTLLQNESTICFLRKAVQNPFQFQITSSAFINGEMIPDQYNETLSPPFEFNYKPSGTQSLAFIVEDIDTFNRRKHWIIYNIPSHIKGLKEGILVLPPGSITLLNDFNSYEYSGPSNTYREHKHRYMFRLIALNVSKIDNISISSKYEDLYNAMNPYILKETTIIGTYGTTSEGHKLAFAA